MTALEVIRLFKRIETEQIELMVRQGTLSEETENISKTIKGLTISTVMTLYIPGCGLYLIEGSFQGFTSTCANFLLALLVISGWLTVIALRGRRRR